MGIIVLTSKPWRLLTSTDTPPKASLYTTWNFIYATAIAIDDSRTGGQSYKATAVYQVIAIKPTPRWWRSSIIMPRCACASPDLHMKCIWQTIKSGHGILDNSCIYLCSSTLCTALRHQHHWCFHFNFEMSTGSVHFSINPHTKCVCHAKLYGFSLKHWSTTSFPDHWT